MSFIEISRTQLNEDTLTTLVQYDFMETPVCIAHFRPQSEDDILLGINNREITEKKKLGLLPPDPEPEIIIE